MSNQPFFSNNNFPSNQIYRQYLMSNADQIISQNQYNSFCEVCNSQFINKNKMLNNPYLHNCNSNSKPPIYEESDLKNNYLNKLNLQKTKIAPYLF